MPVNSIQDVLAQNPTLQSLPPPGFTRPVRFRGVYLHPPSEEDPPGTTVPPTGNIRDEEYYRKINDYFTNHSATSRGPFPENEGFIIEDSNSAPQLMHPDLYTKAIYHPYDKPEQHKAIRKNWKKQNKAKKKPFTVMLDIYPMEREEDMEASAMRPAISRIRPTMYIPLRPGENFLPPDMEIPYVPRFMTPPRQRKKGRMVMKLNLFPKKAHRRQRRTFNLFGNKGDNDGCDGPIGHNPYGKPIIAKWKNKKGEIVHANYVSLNQWGRGDVDLDPR